VYADLAAKYPKFSGTGYIAFPVLRDALREFDMMVELRPDSLNGLVLFSAGHPDAQSDFFSLSLKSGRIELRCANYSHVVQVDHPLKVRQVLKTLIVYYPRQQRG